MAPTLGPTTLPTASNQPTQHPMPFPSSLPSVAPTPVPSQAPYAMVGGTLSVSLSGLGAFTSAWSSDAETVFRRVLVDVSPHLTYVREVTVVNVSNNPNATSSSIERRRGLRAASGGLTVSFHLFMDTRDAALAGGRAAEAAANLTLGF